MQESGMSHVNKTTMMVFSPFGLHLYTRSCNVCFERECNSNGRPSWLGQLSIPYDCPFAHVDWLDSISVKARSTCVFAKSGLLLKGQNSYRFWCEIVEFIAFCLVSRNVRVHRTSASLDDENKREKQGRKRGKYNGQHWESLGRFLEKIELGVIRLLGDWIGSWNPSAIEHAPNRKNIWQRYPWSRTSADWPVNPRIVSRPLSLPLSLHFIPPKQPLYNDKSLARVFPYKLSASLHPALLSLPRSLSLHPSAYWDF